MIRVGILGLGTVGQGVVALINKHQARLKARLGKPIVITHALVRDKTAARACPMAGITLCEDFRAITENPDIDMVVELIGGESTAKAAIESALAHKKPVVTANKALLAKHGTALFRTATENGVRLLYEGSVAATIPIMKSLREALVAHRVRSVFAILNGTSNYILSHMQHNGWSYEQALTEAQKLGYAEADPSFDVGGMDAAHKITLLARLAFETDVAFDEVHVEGITDIHTDDFALADKFGLCIKPLGAAEMTKDGRIHIMAATGLVPKTALIANIHNALACVALETEESGTLFFSGAGAGKEETATAVIADMVELVEHPTLYQQESTLEPRVPILPMGESVHAYYLRLRLADTAGALNRITAFLSAQSVSIREAHQSAASEDGYATVALITEPIADSAMHACWRAIREHREVAHDNATLLRVFS